jgi:hypothetical protein
MKIAVILYLIKIKKFLLCNIIVIQDPVTLLIVYARLLKKAKDVILYIYFLN